MNLSLALRLALAETWVLYFKAHSFHWNVKGPLFQMFHGLFGEIYRDLHGAVDDLAERMRTLNEMAPASLDEISDLSSIIFTAPPSAPEMVSQLIAGNSVVIDVLRQANTQALKAGNDGLANLLQGRLDQHAKWQWKLQATLADDAPAAKQ